MAFFCTNTGVRISAPGVSKAVDPVNGHDEVIELDGVEMTVAQTESLAKKPEPQKSDSQKNHK